VSARLMCVPPTVHWLEYEDRANGVLAEPLEIRDGNAIVPERPGNGIAWDEAAVRRYSV
jgi:mandelate racemase